MENYIAIDNVCAWPNIKMLSDGSLCVVHFNEPCHLRWEGCIDFRISTDGGRSWKFVSHPVKEEPGTNRGNVAVGVGEKDEIVVLCGGWKDVLPRPQIASQDLRAAEDIWAGKVGSEPLWPVCCRSTDRGQSWKVEPIEIPDNLPDFLWIPYGDIFFLPNGRMACSMYSKRRSALAPDYKGTDGKRGSFYFESEDQGRTWNCVSQITAEGGEPALARVSDGRLLAAVRSECLSLFESTDQGRSWRHLKAVTGLREFPGSFLQLKEGYLMLAHGIRKNGLYGIGALFLEPETNTWGRVPLLLCDFGDTKDGGYPSSVQLANGDIVTAYYAKSVPWHSRYHMGVKIWNLAEVGIAPLKPSEAILPK